MVFFFWESILCKVILWYFHVNLTVMLKLIQAWAEEAVRCPDADLYPVDPLGVQPQMAWRGRLGRRGKDGG